MQSRRRSMRSEGEAAAEDGELKESPEAELWIPSMAAPPANVNGVEAWVPGDSLDATQHQERSSEMNRHRWFLTVMAMVVGVALAGPAMGTNHETMPAPHLKPTVMPVPIKPKPPTEKV